MDRSYWYKITVKEKSDRTKKAVNDYFEWKKMNYPSMYKGINSLDSFKSVYYKGYEMKFKNVKVIEVSDLNLLVNEEDDLSLFYEVHNDSYHRFYSSDDYMDKKLHGKIISQLKDNHIITDEFFNSKYNYILLHFSW